MSDAPKVEVRGNGDVVLHRWDAPMARDGRVIEWPRTSCDYAVFGGRIVKGPFAPLTMSGTQAQAFYEDAETLSSCTVSEDDEGIILHGVDLDAVGDTFLGGDWRRFGNDDGLELVMVATVDHPPELAVNIQ